ncbi:hypothetical protein J2S52_002345 [Streptomyces sp. DSM 41037]|nr:hypothetical protein [Streptomyces sp. DSM 41037]
MRMVTHLAGAHEEREPRRLLGLRVATSGMSPKDREPRPLPSTEATNRPVVVLRNAHSVGFERSGWPGQRLRACSWERSRTRG